MGCTWRRLAPNRLLPPQARPSGSPPNIQADAPFVLYLCGGMPRSATTWTFNVVAQLLAHRGIDFDRINANRGARDLDPLLQARPERPALVHFHEVTEALVAHLKTERSWACYSFRDPRDIVVSQMKLHDATLEEAMRITAKSTLSFVNLREAIPPSRVQYLPYRMSVAHPEAVITQLAISLGYIPNPDEVAYIGKQTSKERFQKVMQATRQQSEHSLFTGHRSIHYDPETLINDRHIQSGAHGRWKTELDPSQRDQVEAIFRDIVGMVFEPPWTSNPEPLHPSGA